MSSLYQLLGRVSAFYWLARTQMFDRHFFGGIGRRSRIIQPLQLRNPENIYIGNHVTIANYAWLLTLQASKERSPKLGIGSGCGIGHFNHSACVNSVELGAKVL